jgi:hypothetical protein
MNKYKIYDIFGGIVGFECVLFLGTLILYSIYEDYNLVFYVAIVLLLTVLVGFGLYGCELIWLRKNGNE